MNSPATQAVQVVQVSASVVVLKEPVAQGAAREIPCYGPGGLGYLPEKAPIFESN